MAKTNVVVNFGDDKSVSNIIKTTVMALKHDRKEGLSVEFQIEAVSSGKEFMEVVKEYVIVE